MKARRTVWAAVLVAMSFVLLFEVSVDLRIKLPGETEQPDATQEARYNHCYAEKDSEIHRLAFSTIDNPDVQKEFISTGRAKARNACRAEFPLLATTVKTPFEFNIVDLKARFW